MKMDEEEDVETYLLKVYEVVNSIRTLWEKGEDPFVVQKVLRSLPFRYDAKVSTIEEIKDLTEMTMEELNSILTTCEMRKYIEDEQSNKTMYNFSSW